MRALHNGIRYWFETLDRARQRRGATMDRYGYGPRETPYQVVLSAPGMRLRRYEQTGQDAAAAANNEERIALIVPAPIKRPYIWDLAPECSVVQGALRQGMAVYLVEWTDPVDGDNLQGLDEYGDTLPGLCLDAIEAAHPSGKIFLFGHSLGGVFAAIHAALHPQRIAGLVLIEAPLHFEEATGSFGPLVALGPSADKVTQLFGRVPGSVLNLASVVASPATFNMERYADLVASLGSPQHIRSHLLVERWTLDEAPMAGRLFEQVVERLYRENAFMRGELVVSGARLHPRCITAPLLSVYDPHSVIVPPASVIGFHDASGTERKRLLAYDGDTGIGLAHVGALVGENAHSRLWPQIFAWIGEVCGAANRV